MSTATRERPILFSGPMVNAIREGRKTMTRRVAKPPEKAVFLPDDYWRNDPDEPGTAYLDDFSGRLRITCPYGSPGDRLWVRETFARRLDVDPAEELCKAQRYALYRADGTGLNEPHWHSYPRRWTPAIHMPRWAARIILEITEVRVERLQEISIEDVIAEGFTPVEDGPHANEYWREETGAKFVELWDKLNKPRGFGWNLNPWVWVVTFKPVEA